jgi:hypothetical protein
LRETLAIPTAAAIVRLPHGLLGSLVAVVLVIFRRTKDYLAHAITVWDRQGLQDHIEPVALLMGERRADREPKVILSLTLHDGERAIGWLRWRRAWIGGARRKNAVIPDALFGLRFNDEEESYFMLEIDRGEMPVERYKNAQRTYFSKKMLTYYEANRQQRHVHDLGIANFRVLTVTTNRERVERMLAALDAITNGRGSNMFLFTDQTALVATNPLDLEWVSGKREAGSGALTD